jgi:hypothetical protein
VNALSILDRLMAVDVDRIPHDDINHDQQPIRLLKSDFLERFTHVTPQVVLIIGLASRRLAAMVWRRLPC